MKKQNEKTKSEQKIKVSKKIVLALGSLLLVVIAFFVLYKFCFHGKILDKNSVATLEPKGWIFDCKQSNTGIETLNIYDITANSSAAFLATSKGIYRSLDNGSTWALFNEGTGNNIVSSFYKKDDLVYGLPFVYWKGTSELSYLYGDVDEWSNFAPTGIGSFFVDRANLDQDSRYVLLRESVHNSSKASSKAGEEPVYSADDRFGKKNDFKLYEIGYKDEQHKDGANLWNFKQSTTPFDGYIRNVNNIHIYDKVKKTKSLVSLIEVRKDVNDRKFYYQDIESKEWVEYMNFDGNKYANLAIFETGIYFNANQFSLDEFYENGIGANISNNSLVLYNYGGRPEIDSPEYIRNYEKSKDTVVSGLDQGVKLSKIILLDNSNVDNGRTTGTIAGYSADKGVYTCNFRSE